MIQNWRRMNLESLDQIVCSGNGKLSKKIKWFNRLTGIKGEAAEITHVGQVIGGRAKRVFESTTLNKFSGKRGVQTNYFDKWLKYYNGRVWIRKIFIEDEVSRAVYESSFKVFANKLIGTDYESGIPALWELVLCGLRLHKVPALDKLHCTETNIYTLQELGLFDPEVLPNNYPPHTFWTGGDVERGLLPEAKLGVPIRIK